MIPAFRRPMAEQVGNGPQVEREEGALLFVARGQNLRITGGAQAASPPVRNVLDVNRWGGLGERAQRGLGDVNVQQELQAWPFAGSFARARWDTRAAASCCCIQARLLSAWRASSSISPG